MLDRIKQTRWRQELLALEELPPVVHRGLGLGVSQVELRDHTDLVYDDIIAMGRTEDEHHDWHPDEVEGNSGALSFTNEDDEMWGPGDVDTDFHLMKDLAVIVHTKADANAPAVNMDQT